MPECETCGLMMAATACSFCDEGDHIKSPMTTPSSTPSHNKSPGFTGLRCNCPPTPEEVAINNTYLYVFIAVVVLVVVVIDVRTVRNYDVCPSTFAQ